MNARCPRLAAAALALPALAFAQSADRPWYLGAAQEFMHLSNVLYAPTNEASDTVSTTTLRGGVNARLGRQRLYANGTASHQRFSEVSERDNNGYNLAAGLDWETIENLSGNLVLNSVRQQANFFVGGIVPQTISNIERSNDVGLRARLGVVTALTFDVGAGHRQVNFSAPEYASREYKQDNGSLGVTWQPSGILGLSVGVSAADTKFQAPAALQTAADRSKRRDVFLGAVWVPTGASSISARLAFGKTEYDRATASDFEGVTGSLAWKWRPSGLLAVTTTLSRDSGQETGFLRLVDGSSTSATDFSRLTNRIAVAAQYELTGKVGLSATVSHARRTLVDGLTGASGRDDTTGLSLGARWAATRTLSLGCFAGRESRSASGSESSDYDADRFGCYGALTLD